MKLLLDTHAFLWLINDDYASLRGKPTGWVGVANSHNAGECRIPNPGQVGSGSYMKQRDRVIPQCKAKAQECPQGRKARRRQCGHAAAKGATENASITQAFNHVQLSPHD